MNSTAAELLRQIVAIPSVNPALSDDDALRNELRIVDWLEPWFAARGFETRRVGQTTGRPNLLATFGAAAPRKTIRSPATMFPTRLEKSAPTGFQRMKSRAWTTPARW